MKYPIKSILEDIATSVFQMTDLIKAKLFINNFVEERDINETDKKNILIAVNECKSMYKLQYYISNSLLRYEGLSVNKTFEKKKIEIEAIIA